MSNMSINNVNKTIPKRRIVYYQYNYSLFHFNNIHISQDGVLQLKCIIFNLKGGCGCKVNNNIFIGRIKQYRNVFSITQTWGNAVFHSIVECLTKIGIYLNELIYEQSIFIHLYNSAAVNYLVFLGIKRKRIIHGNVYSSSLIITSKSNCGSYSNIHSLYYLRNALRKKSKLDYSIEVVFIRRRGTRSVCNYKMLCNEILKHYKLKVYNYNDTILKISKLFSSAKVVIAPHGAGLSNILFCKIDTLILEFLDSKRINLCYSGLAYSLGLKYVGILTLLNNDNCFNVNVSLIMNILIKMNKVFFN